MPVIESEVAEAIPAIEVIDMLMETELDAAISILCQIFLRNGRCTRDRSMLVRECPVYVERGTGRDSARGCLIFTTTIKLEINYLSTFASRLSSQKIGLHRSRSQTRAKALKLAHPRSLTPLLHCLARKSIVGRLEKAYRPEHMGQLLITANAGPRRAQGVFALSPKALPVARLPLLRTTFCLIPQYFHSLSSQSSGFDLSELTPKLIRVR